MDPIDYYSKNANMYYDATKDLSMEDQLEKFISLLPEGSSVLDLGCGSGRDSLYLIEKGFDVTALDGSKELCELAEIHIGQDVLNMKFEEMNFLNVFDGVWASASFVHLVPEKLEIILEKVISSLKIEGVLYISLKYGDFSGIRNGRYFQYYKMRVMKEILSKFENVELIESWKTNDIRSTREEVEWLNILVKKIK
ncbi:class I SAM-dependent methyltransferase [Anaeromicropila herbilytica]|uniref:Tellurite resistance n=1 Tax=Anaeromicropila herbilytica TaxID=2785025 RepID=A0A7R7EJ18_9FIRM|nr:class I SAM-dependent methyltransferase [Anaeromicropila herbilytica]BCN29649.1 tellurite resistance [Anaeromicropila herbilytica]